MAYDAKTQRLISLKKLAGKAQTSNDKDLANEGLPSGITLASNTIFGESISTAPSDSSLYMITGKVEYVRFPATFIAGSDTSDGRHGFELKLPSDYESNSSNSKAGTYPFINNQVINITSGALQLVPPSFATSYEAKPYYGGTSSKDSGTQIPILDARDWYLDYFNGILFQQDPPGTGDHAENPDFVEAYLYIGKMLDAEVNNAAEAFFTSPSNGFINTTGSAAFAGELGSSYTTAMVGSDVSFFVSGAIGSTGTSARGNATFGGDVVASGTVYAGTGSSDVRGLNVYANISGDYAAVIENDNGSSGHGLRVTSDGTGSGTRLFDIEADETPILRVRGDGRVGIGKVTSLPDSKLTVSSSNDDSDIAVAHRIQHIGDSDTYIQFENDEVQLNIGGETLLTLKEHNQDIVTIGDGGDVDFRVKTLNDDNTIFVQGNTDRVGIGLNSPSVTLHIKDSPAKIRLQREDNSESSTIQFAGSAGVVGAAMSHDGNTNDLKFDVFNGSSVEEIMRLRGYQTSNNRQVIFLSGSEMHADDLQPREMEDICFFVSGAIDSKDTSDRGTSVIGGDTVISGTLHGDNGVRSGGHILPKSDNIYDLGGMSNRWANIYTGDLHLKNERGDWTIVEEAEYLTVINNLT